MEGGEQGSWSLRPPTRPRKLTVRRPSVRNRAATLWSEVLRMLNDTGEHEACYSADGLCIYCRQAPATTADHLRPVGSGICRAGQRIVVPCCSSCNSSKGKREFGLWMVNKFGLTSQTLATICDLQAMGEQGTETPSEGKAVAEPGLSDPTVTLLREMCYGFCERLHAVVVVHRAAMNRAD